MKIFCLLLLLLCSMNSMSQEKIPFEIRDGHFYRYGEKPLFFLERCIMSVYHTNIGATACRWWKEWDLIPWQRMFLGISTRLNQFFRRWESGGIYKDCRGGSDDGHPSSRTLCLCRVGIRRVSLVAAEYTRYGK